MLPPNFTTALGHNYNGNGDSKACLLKRGNTQLTIYIELKVGASCAHNPIFGADASGTDMDAKTLMGGKTKSRLSYCFFTEADTTAMRFSAAS